MKYRKEIIILLFMILFTNYFILSVPKNFILLRKRSIQSTSKISKIPKGLNKIKGYVFSKEGKPLKNAIVTVTHENKTTIFKSLTDENGLWTFKWLGSGEFEINVICKYYLPYKRFFFLSSFIYDYFPINVILKKPTKEELIEQYKKSGQLPDVAIISLKEKLLNAETFFKEGKYDMALDLYNYILEIAPKIYQIIFRTADCYRKKSNVLRAIEIYNRGIEIAIGREDTISTAKAYGVIGSIYQKNKDLKTANYYFKKSLDMAPKDAIIAYNYAEYNFDLNNMKIDIAIKYYKMAIKIKPTWGLPYKQLGYAYLNKDDRKNAIKIFKQFLEIDPNSKYAKAIKKIINPKKLRRRRR